MSEERCQNVDSQPRGAMTRKLGMGARVRGLSKDLRNVRTQE